MSSLVHRFEHRKVLHEAIAIEDWTRWSTCCAACGSRFSYVAPGRGKPRTPRVHCKPCVKKLRAAKRRKRSRR